MKIKKLLYLIIHELKPYLNPQEYAHLQLIASHVIIKYIDDNINTINLYDTHNHYISSISITPYNQIIDIAPIDNHDIKPILLMRKDASNIQSIHEICHLLSIGTYQNYHHTLGINEYIYDSHYHCTNKYEHYYLNEWMNDIMTSYFMKTLFFIDYHGQHDKLYDYIKDIDQMIHWYFSGQVSCIKEVLGDYDCLYQYIS